MSAATNQAETDPKILPFQPSPSPDFWEQAAREQRAKDAAREKEPKAGDEVATYCPGCCVDVASHQKSGSCANCAGKTTESVCSLHPGSGAKPTIKIQAGEITKIVNQAEAALIARGAKVYQRGPELVFPTKLEEKKEAGGIRRAAGSVVLNPVTKFWLVEQMGQTATWKVFSKTEKEWQVVDPRPLYANTLLERKEWGFRVLRGVSNSPTLAPDGRVIQTPGYDARSGLLLDFAPGDFPPVPENPTEAQAREALRALKRPLRGFPFVDEAARSVALSAMLTSLVRGAMRKAPLHAFDANMRATGKSKLANIVGVLKNGVTPAAMSQGKSNEEDEKRLSACLRAGDSVIWIDNCELPLGGDFLCSMLTEEIVQARILGLSERIILPSTALVLATGNNLTTAGDISTRVVVCRLDAKDEHPESRPFDFDAVQEVRDSRPALLVAGLTILRAYVVAGRPGKLKPHRDYDDWGLVRGALVWLGEKDPASTCESVAEADTEKDDLIGVMALWAVAHGDKAVAVDAVSPKVRDKLAEVACGGFWSAKKVTWWLKKNRDVLVGGKAFRSKGESRRDRLWNLASGPVQGEL